MFSCASHYGGYWILNPKASLFWVAKSAGTVTDGSTVEVGEGVAVGVEVGEGVMVGVEVGDSSALASGVSAGGGASAAGRSHAASTRSTETANTPSFFNEISLLRASGHPNTVSSESEACHPYRLLHPI